MIRPLLFCALFAVSAPLLASSFAGTSAGSSADSASDASSKGSSSSSGDDKIILAAREEAAGFVASNGKLRGARLQAALHHLRQREADATTASDMQLARAILAR